MRKKIVGLMMVLLALSSCKPSLTAIPTEPPATVEQNTRPSFPTIAPATAVQTAQPSSPTNTLPSSRVITALPPAAGSGNTLTLNLSAPGRAISQNLYGIFFEEDNHAGDGGIYAELIRNRSFNEDDNSIPVNWSWIASNGSAGSMGLDFNQPLNALNRSLKLQIDQVNNGGRVGVANGGFWGIQLVHGTAYTASFYAKAAAGFNGPLTVSLENKDGTVLAQAAVAGISGDWKKYTQTLTVNNPDGTTSDNQMVISAAAQGTVWLQVVSLFPPTWKNRPNGLRSDIMQLLADMHPRTCRFPGGTSVEGLSLKDRYQWKQTIGDLTLRPGHMGVFGYFVSDGLGFHELLQMCEDLGAIPVYDAYAGYSHISGEVVSEAALQPYIQDALDAIEYANGDASTAWGAKRAANGHPAPFNLKYIEVGNEDWLNSAQDQNNHEGPDSYGAYRFRMFYDQIKAKYPDIQLISTMPVASPRADIQDDHMYRTSLVDALQELTRGASPKRFMGEWAQVDWSNLPTPTAPPPDLNLAIPEAAFLTGIENNGDSYWGSSYAPLLVNSHDRHFNWGPIYYDAMTAFGTPTYYVQAMFAGHVGDVLVPTSLTGGNVNLYYSASRVTGDKTVFLKVVNNGNSAQVITIQLNGAGSLDSTGRVTVLASGSRTDGNTFVEPNKVAPAEMQLQGIAPAFGYSFPPNSVTILTLTNGGASPATVQSAPTTTLNPPTIAPGGPSSAKLMGYWKFDEGNGVLAADSSGNGNAGRLQGGAGWADGKVGAHAIALTGATNSFVTIPKAVVDTGKSFSVAAWVKLNALDNYQTSVSIDGATNSGFYLQWRKDTGKFALTLPTADVQNPDSIFVSAKSIAAAGTWYHLVGVFDGNSIKLYVNGELQETKSFSTAWKAAGPTAVGRAKFNGATVDYFNGWIDDVRIYAGALTDQEAAALAAGN